MKSSTMKKVVSMALAMGMVMTMNTAVFAATPDYSHTTADKTVDVSSHSFEAYQIFSGTQSDDSVALGNVEWGNGVNGTAMLTALQKDSSFNTTTGEGDEAVTVNDFASCTTAADVAKVVANYGDDSAKARAFAKVAYANKTTTTTEMTGSGTSYTISTPGYYLINDTTDTADKDTATNLALLAVSTTATITSKVDIPSVDKKVYEDSMTKWMDSADYDEGDMVPFQLTATLGDISEFNTYYISFDDTLSDGLDFNASSVKVYVKNTDDTTATEVTDYFSVTYGKNDDDTDNEQVVYFTCNDVKAATVGAKSGATIIVYYEAELTEDAVIGSAGNPNEVKLEYSNNPNEEGKGETPEDKVIVFTYKLVTNKVNESGEALAGAGFTLYKYDASKVVAEADATEANPACDGYVVATQTAVVSGDKNDVFTWNRIDSGKYKLVETTTPAGYNTIDPIYFEVRATYDETNDNPALTALEVYDANGNLLSDETVTATFTAVKDDGQVANTVENKKGSVLPTTGGIGTTIFYVCGMILVLGAGVVLVARKRIAR